MAFLSTKTAVAIAVQSGPGTWGNPTAADLYPCSAARLQIDAISAENPEYTGTIHRQGALIIGKTASITLTFLIRPPGGSSPPAAGAWVPGRVLRAAGFTENLMAAAIPASAEALGSATTTSATLGAGAAATAGLYKGLGISLVGGGASYMQRLTSIRDYSAAKLAALFETYGTAPTGNYQIPKQLAYSLSASAALPWLSVGGWYDAVRYDIIDCSVSALKFNFPTATRDSTEFPTMEVTLEGDLYAFTDEACPAIPALGAPPSFKDGDFWLAGKALGGSSFSLDMGAQLGRPPNANRASGNDPAQMTETRRSAQITLNHNSKAAFDPIALADAQSLHGLFAQYGYGAGSAVQFNIPNGRLSYPNPDNGGAFVTQTMDLLIDDVEKSINLVFAY